MSEGVGLRMRSNMILVNEQWLRDALTQGVCSSCPPFDPSVEVLRDGTIVQEVGAGGGSGCTGESPYEAKSAGSR